MKEQKSNQETGIDQQIYTKEFDGKQVIIMSTDKCNTKCKHCYIDYKGCFKGERLSELVRELVKKYDVYINGTEVLLHPDFLEAIGIAGQVKIQTNGLVILDHPDLLQDLKNRGIKQIQLSYHFGIHDSISGVQESRLGRAIDLIKQAGLKLKLAVTVTKQNYLMVDQICKNAQALGAKIVKFINLISSGKVKENLSADLLLHDAEIEVFLKQVEDARNKFDKNNLIIERSGTFGKADSVHNNFHCTAGTNKVVVTPDMEIFPCIGLTAPEYKIGEVRDNKLMITKQVKNAGLLCMSKVTKNDGVDFSTYLIV